MERLAVRIAISKQDLRLRLRFVCWTVVMVAATGCARTPHAPAPISGTAPIIPGTTLAGKEPGQLWVYKSTQHGGFNLRTSSSALLLESAYMEEVRAIDCKTGRELWVKEMPASRTEPTFQEQWNVHIGGAGPARSDREIVLLSTYHYK